MNTTNTQSAFDLHRDAYISAKILVRYFGWRWFLDIKKGRVLCWPPIPDTILGYERSMCPDETIFDQFYKDVTEEYVKDSSKFLLFTDFYRLCHKQIDSRNYVHNLPMFASDRNLYYALFTQILKTVDKQIILDKLVKDDPINLLLKHPYNVCLDLLDLPEDKQ
jgi:hypothetical protein